MKKRAIWVIAVLAAVLLSACGGQKETGEAGQAPAASDGLSWQEQYDLGVRYLSEGNYREAILAFTAAIEIDPKQAPAYVGRGDAYVLSGKTEENLTAAKADYETAIEMDETAVAAWLGLADVYIRQGDNEKALEILRQGLEKTGQNQDIADKIAEMETEKYVDPYGGNFRRMDDYSPEGELVGYTEFFYDESGRRVRRDDYSYYAESSDGSYEVTSTARFVMWSEFTYDAQNRLESEQIYEADGTWFGYLTFVYSNNLMIECHQFSPDGSEVFYSLAYSDAQGRTEKTEGYSPDGELSGYSISEHDESGNLIRATSYYPDGTISNYILFEYE